MNTNEKDEMKEEHPDIIDLELYRTGEADDELQSHIDSCEQCQAEIEFLDGLSNDMSASTVEADFSALDGKVEADIQSLKVLKKMTNKTLTLVLIKVAALILLVVFIGQLNKSINHEKQDVTVESKGKEKLMLGDINDDGVVDVIDNYLFAKRLQSEDEIASHMDINQDGNIDTVDLEALSNQIVALGGGG